MTVWLVVGLTGVATALLKGLGPVLLGGRTLPARVLRPVALVGPAVLAALVVTQAAAGDRRLVADARLVGLAVAAVLVWRKAPVLVVVGAAAAATAIARAV